MALSKEETTQPFSYLITHLSSISCVHQRQAVCCPVSPLLLMLKRFQSNELGESASRRVGYDCTAEYAKSSRSTCRVCDVNIEQDELRLALMLQDEEGYKNTAWMHFSCFWKHPETTKIKSTHEIHNWSKLRAEDQERWDWSLWQHRRVTHLVFLLCRISAEFTKLHSSTAAATKTKAKKKLDNDPSDDEDFSPQQKRTTRRTRKRKRGAETDWSISSLL